MLALFARSFSPVDGIGAGMRVCPLLARHIAVEISSDRVKPTFGQRTYSVETPGKTLSIGIRREGKNRWERRVALSPKVVERLVKDLNCSVYVQPSTKRIFGDERYAKAGALVQEDLSNADIIFGVKEVAINELIPEKTYVFFSHTHKGQPYNMRMLKEIMDKRIRLIDYELMTDDNLKRLVLFGAFAGYAGIVDSLHGLGLRLLASGYGTPFLHVGMTHMYRSLFDAKAALRMTGLHLEHEGLPRSLGPTTIVFTGAGHVTQGAKEVFECLPHEYISANDLKPLVEGDDFDPKRIYACQVKAEDYAVRKDGKPFERQDYLAHPELYESVFHEKFAPYATVIVNGIYWDRRYPRILTREQFKHITADAENRGRKGPKLMALADISCDFEGSIEFMNKASTIDSPFYYYDPLQGTYHNNIEAPGIQIMSIDNLPTELPLEASEYFSKALSPFVREMLKDNFEHPVVARATITDLDGKLVGRHQKLLPSIEKYGTPAPPVVKPNAKVLVLGSGLVASPAIEYLLKNPEWSVTVASADLAEAKRLARGRPRVPVEQLNISDAQNLARLIEETDCVVSLVPAALHPVVARECLKQRTPMVTASYISSDMKALDAEAKNLGVTIVNEIGLDPGLDHCEIMRIIDHAKKEGGVVKKIVSLCGGLVSPESSDNPIGYKYTWSPRGALTAALNAARFKEDGKIVTIPGPELLQSARPLPIYKGFNFELIPNRDSISYAEMYGVADGTEAKGLDTILRGTIRYTGYCEIMDALREFGILSLANASGTLGVNSGHGTWAESLQHLLGAKSTSKTDLKTSVVYRLLGGASSRKWTPEEVERVWGALEWFDFINPASKLSWPANVESPLMVDLLAGVLSRRLALTPHERDLVVMHHEIGVLRHDGKTRQDISSTLVLYGEPNGHTAMSKTVGLPVAIAAEMIVKGELTRPGVLAPLASDIYTPVLARCEEQGIRFLEKVTTTQL
ncbi:hypothetical protein M427DRAFT_119187 [Gonapodya prolifera JEL478]|uniref:Uncharacterized protein n=1 Tax=Gonapodya prolifera (strain JEL478) TaxID=1344416 RepID=A0A139AXD2_GONPJ|nr:hypothetical protein M427DRAFT_119187 [Gonapodya prolifera JEL478]|eukprot:KXS21364.1 hypothetical protein M427DRAFT_119187 [Gonapodya prolifera JEL478]